MAAVRAAQICLKATGGRVVLFTGSCVSDAGMSYDERHTDKSYTGQFNIMGVGSAGSVGGGGGGSGINVNKNSNFSNNDNSINIYGNSNNVRERERLSVYGTEEEVGLYSSLETSILLSTASTGTDKQGKVENDRRKERSLMEETIQLAEECSLNNICVDVFVFVEDRLLSNRHKMKRNSILQNDNSNDVNNSNNNNSSNNNKDPVDLTYKDIAILAECSDKTGGNTHFVTGSMHIPDNIKRLADEVVYSINQTFVTEVIMKLRSSTGVKLHNYYGSGKYHSILGESQYCGLNADSTMCLTVRHDSPEIKDEDRVHFQLAVLHTDVHMRRIVRVLNLTLTASASPPIVFRHADLDCIVTTITKISVEKALKKPLSITPNVVINGNAVINDDTPARDYLVAVAADILGACGVRE